MYTQERDEHAVLIENINTETVHVSSTFNVRLPVEWRERPAPDALTRKIEHAIRTVLQTHALSAHRKRWLRLWMASVVVCGGRHSAATQLRQQKPLRD
jgi:hypothetical protein